ncbi:uncharacterized protein N7479_002627 [Penicillium vulpinum]|uniref:Zn(2)-C6 fungal-type domain-containing protein n=1 Tax=Penicillium vulpinum TaxID=29845 RepID=A0A1V6RZ36_9EURO|nr:uncharacterized protein N7479_002627 [Penicillium vulpinum]KAJ5972709.1 hypothetical protein N7479_002627 [Penicillium vulpinum]OQE07025.1 hypothetical protein PENVUL_c015G02705 [Penicillium vulpinum]
MSTINQSEADRVLHLKSREREAHACYACRKRKVKCDGGQPCRTCQKRKHPEICTYTVANSRRRLASRHSVARLASPKSPVIADNEPALLDDSSKNYVYSGDNSVVSLLRLRASDANESVAREVGSVLGLRNTFSNFPFMDPKTPLERWKSLLTIMPQRSEALKFFHFFRIMAYPFNPILADIDRFESDLCTYLNAHASGELCDPEKITDRWATDKSIGHVSLLLATLASGAHYSDIDYPERLELSIDFARRSFDALRLANFLFRPSLDIIQALLILGNTLQNVGQSDAAWALLGTTIRLAQTMGLHTESSTVHWPEQVRMKARTLWSTIICQDSLLCLRYDRPPIVSVTRWSLANSFFDRQDLSYIEVMHLLCHISLDSMRPESPSVAEFDRALEALQRLDDAHQRGLRYLRSREGCTTLQQHLEHLALRMHTSFCVSVFCRPAIKQSTPQPFHPHAGILRARAKESLIDASEAFLDFQALSTIPLRNWSMVHTVLSSTLLLCIWEETRNDPECRNLQQKVIHVFSSSNSRTNDDGAAFSESNSQWLSDRHIRALVTLRSALDREQETGTTETESWAGMDLNMEPQFVPGPIGSMNMPDSFDVSPITYLDSIMNFPIFDYTQENGFL